MAAALGPGAPSAIQRKERQCALTEDALDYTESLVHAIYKSAI